MQMHDNKPTFCNYDHFEWNILLQHDNLRLFRITIECDVCKENGARGYIDVCQIEDYTMPVGTFVCCNCVHTPFLSTNKFHGGRMEYFNLNACTVQLVHEHVPPSLMAHKLHKRWFAVYHCAVAQVRHMMFSVHCS